MCNYRAWFKVLQVFWRDAISFCMRILIKTLGCKANRSDSEKLSEMIDGEVFFDKSVLVCDVCIVNTCTVTHVADRKSREAVLALRRENPSSSIIVFGCGVKVDEKGWVNVPGVNFVCTDFKEVVECVKDLNCKFKCEKKKIKSCSNENLLRTRAVLKIQDGCNNFCSYCIIPFARGRERSVPVSEILSDVKKMVSNGVREIVLTGINIGNWGDSGLNLAQLIMKILDETSLLRLRLSSIEPQNFVKEFGVLLTDKRYRDRFCPHLHMSLQSGCDSVLTAMRRHYSVALYKKVARELMNVRPEIALTTDVIVGFPGETEDGFNETCEFVRGIGFAKVHVFPYSKRAGTKAALMDGQIPENVKKERAHALSVIAEKLRLEFFERNFGKVYPVLFEHKTRGFCEGFTPNYIKVRVDSEEDLFNQVLDVKLLRSSDKTNVVMVEGILTLSC